jgi:hypothetical protein
MAYITRYIGFAEVHGGGGNLEFAYDTEKPFAVAMTILIIGETPVRWDLSRDVLARRVPGLHDVTVDVEGQWTYIHLSGSEGKADLRIVRQHLDTFLQRTARAVPYGSEVIQFDAELEQLLSGGAR